MTDIVEMLQVDHAAMKSRQQANRARFPIGPVALAWANENFPCAPGTRGHSIPYAENAAGETIGKRDPGPWTDGDMIVRIAEWNARVYGNDEPQRDRVKRLRKEAA